jgi:ferric-dicitrate binding protein FerR (iron transport regulator)
MSNPTIISIIERYSTDTLSLQEEAILTEWLETVSAADFHATLEQCAVVPERIRNYPVMSAAFAQGIESRLDQLDQPDAQDAADAIPVRVLPWRKWTAAAAAAILLVSAGYYFLNRPVNKTADTPVIVKANDVAPGGDGAILTLANGEKIVLDSAANGKLAVDGNAAITKTGNGQLAYKTIKSGKLQATNQIAYNTLTTPRGKKTHVTLADGTQVWLNASSSIRFPTNFTGTDRTVEITGEAYFEVAKNTAMPFIVKKSGTDYGVQVLGTSFNVNAYDDESAIRTTLLDGSVRVYQGAAGGLLKPGQQAVCNGQGKIDVINDVNIGNVMAWKNGVFHFDRSDIGTVMRQIARWYDVDVTYKGTITQHFGGTISRDVNVSRVFDMLEMTGAVKFSIEGRKVTVVAP